MNINIKLLDIEMIQLFDRMKSIDTNSVKMIKYFIYCYDVGPLYLVCLCSSL